MCQVHLGFDLSLLLFGLYIWVHIIQLWKEQVKPMQYTVGIKSRADGTKLLHSDSRFFN